MPHTQKDLYKKLLGGRGERAALKYLKKQGLKPVCRNYSTPFGEVDLIMREGETLAFIEVKTRTGTEYGTPSQAVDKAKRERYKRAAAFYLKSNSISQESVFVRFDVVEVFALGVPKSVTVGTGEEPPKKEKRGQITVRHVAGAFI